MKINPDKKFTGGKAKKDTSWEKSARWYDDLLKNDDTYQAKVILPNLIRFLELKKTDRVLDLACGQGFFAGEFAKESGEVHGADLSRTLISLAEKNFPKIKFHVANAEKLSFSKDKYYDAVVIVLGLQNMENISAVFKEVGRVMKDDAKLVFVLNHPAFRIPKGSAWGYDEESKIQFRRIDTYLSPAKINIEMHPGKEKSESTVSFHRSLQDHVKALRGAGFAITRLEEWISHKKSQPGPRAKAEDVARKEIPMFLALEAKILK